MTLAKRSQPARERRYWLIKSEPSSFSFDHLLGAPKRTTSWEGVRNYQARNLLRDEMQRGDGVLFYHSSTDVPAIVGEAEVVREGYPDPTAFDASDSHYDARSTRESPAWFTVDVRAVSRFEQEIPLARLRQTPGLERMVLVQKGSRLSVQPVTAEEWRIVHALAVPSQA